MAKIDGVRFLNSQFRKALILESPDPSLDDYLRAQGIEPERLPDSVVQHPEVVIQRLREGQHDLLFKRSRFIVDEAILQASENLAAVILCCIGDDSVDKEACAREGVMVMNDPISNARSVVELVFGEMICLARRVFQANEAAHRHIWTKDNKKRYELLGKTISIIGLGNIGKQVAQMAEKFGMEVYFYDTREVAREVGVTLGWKSCRTLTEAFRAGDFVTVHVSAEDHHGRPNRNLITYEHFAQLGADRGPNSPRIFINVARGFVHTPEDLIRAVREGYVQAAAVDVYPEEPGSKEDAWHNPYAGLPEIVCTPHIGAATEEAQPRIAAYVAGTAQLFNKYGTVRDTVFSPGQVIGVEAEPPYWVLSVVHSDARGTKKAISDAIYEAGASNLQSNHRDFSRYGFAYDVSAIDKPLSEEQLRCIIEKARRISGDPTAIRAIRQFYVPANGA
ncbi:NAD(P)-dependent oxidoreductase [Rhodothermus bifroesti]|uniref:3-phosphoglycerate dehydrogenase n=1 Tax=Rhodothermus marinus TaxID=29549 RepID=A0A7V2B0Z9_RHOMR|nr:NAD(P)-dependent oxidoreductase [Rhodothermus bifroesti]GBD00984.1 D-3-phosphoglycerate dehydrogenase [bacterium HR18]